MSYGFLESKYDIVALPYFNLDQLRTKLFDAILKFNVVVGEISVLIIAAVPTK